MAESPTGNPEADVIPVTSVVACVTGVMELLTDIDNTPVAGPTVRSGLTVKVLVVAVQPPVVVKVNVAVPADTAVMTPELLFMVATEGLELDQVPEPAGIIVVGALEL